MSTAKVIELTDKNVCEMCRNVLGQYKCPKCNVLYCSLDCYQSKSHLQCSETFYKDSLYEQLRADDGEDKAKEKMMDILKRTHEANKIENSSEEKEELDSDDDSSAASDSDDLADRMKGVNLDNAEDVWQHLDDDEKRQFEKFLASGDVSQYITKWQPWWTYACAAKVLDTAEFEKHAKQLCPARFAGIKKYSELTKKQPAECLRHNMSNILASYLFICRYFNGEQLNAVVEAVTYLLTICLTLKDNINFDSTDMAVTSVKMQCQTVNWILTDSENLDCIDDDLKQVWKGPHTSQRNYYIICALSELHTVLTKALNAKNTDLNSSEFYRKFTDGQFPNVVTDSKVIVRLAKKKIEYFLAYASDFL